MGCRDKSRLFCVVARARPGFCLVLYGRIVECHGNKSAEGQKEL